VADTDETFCKKCFRWGKKALTGLCTACAVAVATPAVSIASPSPIAPTTHVVYRPWSPGDSEPFHPAEPGPTLDGPAFPVMGTIPTMHLVIEPYGHWRPSRQHYNGGAIPTT
jgi:hypothetical protein